MPVLYFHANSFGPALTVEEPTGGALVDICDDVEAPVPFSCRGASCGTCRVEIITGAQLLAPPQADELDVLAAFGNLPNHRLACCAQVLEGSGVIELRVAEEESL